MIEINDEQATQTLLLETHRCSDLAAADAVAKLGQQRQRPLPAPGDVDPEALLVYPPSGTLSSEEERTLRSMQFSALERSAVQKVIADSCATAFFRFFALIDAVGDPEVKPPPDPWMGAWIIAPENDDDRTSLHDGFFESRWNYDEIMG